MRLVRAMAPEPPKHEHVDVDGRLVELGLSVHLPSVVWPEMAAIRELSTKIKALGKTGQECVFVAVDLRKYVWNFAVACWMAVTIVYSRFIPSSWPDHLPVNLEAGSEAKKGGGKGSTGQRSLDLATWLLAWDRHCSLHIVFGIGLAFALCGGTQWQQLSWSN